MIFLQLGHGLGEIKTSKMSKIGSYLARNHIVLVLIGLCAVGLVQWRMLSVLQYQNEINKDIEALRLVDSCSSSFSSALLCADLVLSGGSTYLAQTSLSYLEETKICLDDLKSFDIYSKEGFEVTHTVKDLDSIVQVLNNVSEIKAEERANDQQALSQYYGASERLVNQLTNISAQLLEQSESRKNKLSGMWGGFFTLTLLIATVFFLIILFIWRRQTRMLAYPIQELAHQTKSAVTNQLEPNSPPFSVETPILEIDNLRRGFAYFAEELLKNQQELENTVRDRTFELSKALDVAVKANDTKTAFLANMSHELRTPLNAIIGYGELSVEELRDLPKNPEIDEIISYLQQINKSGQNLLNQINDILDISKIEAGKVDLDIEKFELSALLGDVVYEMNIIAERNQNTLTYTSDQDTILVKADRSKIRQVLVNVVGNACKFTNAGRVELNVTTSVPPNRQWVYIAVVDNGIGIDSMDIMGLFEPYEQSGGSKRYRAEGTGLGLAISKRLCQLHGGSISVESELNVGSMFTIRLPIRCD